MSDLVISLITLVSIAVGVAMVTALGNYLGIVDVAMYSSEAIRKRELKRLQENA